MPLGDGKAKQEAQEISSELKLILDAVSSIGDTLVSSLEDGIESVSGLNSAVDIVSKTIKRGFIADLKESVKNTDLLIGLQTKATQGILKASEAEKVKAKILANEAKLNARISVIRKQGGKIDEESVILQREQIKNQLKQLDALKESNKINQDTLGLLDLAKTSAIGFANNIDKSGTLAKVLNGELNNAQKTTLAAQAGFAILVASILKGSDLIADIRKQTGLSAEAARDLQLEFSSLALTSDKIFITSEKLNKSFLELTKQTGLIADFGGDILITQTTLTKQLKLSSESAGKISTLARIQSKDTEGILDNTVDAVSALSRQEQVGLNVQGILEEVGSVSEAIAVSLGKNPTSIALAVAQAKLLGLSLSEVDGIASSLLDFETSIANELAAELLINKDINLEKARSLALNNDLAGLSEEIRENEELRLAFSTGNRIQQEAAAKAIGVNRDQLAKIVLQQDLIALGSERFISAYGEATYQSLQAQSASEKFSDTLDKIKGILLDIGTAFAPILDGIASFTAGLLENKAAVAALAGVFTTLLALSVAKSIADAIISFTLAFGPAGVPLGIAAGAGILAAVGTGLAIADDMVAPAGYGDRILSTPKGSIALNNQDTVVAGTNLGGGNNESKRTNTLLEKILNKQGTVKIDSTRAGTAFAMGTYQVQ